MKEISSKLIILCNTMSAELKLVSEVEFSLKPSVRAWSKKEILGHLIDSAAKIINDSSGHNLKLRLFIMSRISGSPFKSINLKAQNF